MSVKSESINKRGMDRLSFAAVQSKFGVYFMILALIIVGIFISNKFFTVDNFINILQAVSLLGIVSLGVSFVTYSGHFVDMSVPSMMAFAGIITVQLLPFGIVVSILGGLGAGVLIGTINGFLVGKLRANPIIWTLATQFILTGLLRWIYAGNQIYPDVIAGNNMAAVDAFYAISRTYVFGKIPLAIIILLVLAGVCQFILSKTLYGKQLKLTGSNIDAAKFSGINVRKNIWIAFILCGLFSAVGGILLSSFSKVGAYYMGEGYDFNTITAIVLGGMTLFGGRGNIVGVVGGAITIGLLSNVMTFIGVDTFSQMFVKGIIFIIIVWLNSFSLRKLGKDYV